MLPVGLLSLARWPTLRRVYVVTNFFHFTVVEAVVLLEIFKVYTPKVQIVLGNVSGFIFFNYVFVVDVLFFVHYFFLFLGRSCYSSRQFMLSVDRNIVQDNISSFVSALCMMFGSYYCFNIHYPSELASTLEFLQRCVFVLALSSIFTLLT